MHPSQRGPVAQPSKEYGSTYEPTALKRIWRAPMGVNDPGRGDRFDESNAVAPTPQPPYANPQRGKR